MRFAPLALLSAATILAAACTPGAGATSRPNPTATVSPTAAATAGPTAAPSPSAQPSQAASTRIEVRLTDTMTIEPAAMTVPAGVPVTFVVTNAGVLEHEFYLGDEEAQQHHESEMQSMGGMGHDDPEGIAVEPGETRDLTYTFASPGETLAGCHVAGHYVSGMKATITIVP